MSKAFFIVPGFHEQATQPQYKWLRSLLKKKGFNVFPVPMKWDYRVMSDYADQFRSFYDIHKQQVNYVLGFSYGAVVTFLTATELKPQKIFLCSLSPDFKEDSVKMKQWVRNYIGKRRFADTKTRSARKIAKELSVPSVVFYGEKEGRQYPQLKIRCAETAKLAKRSKLVVVKDAPHKISDPEYVKALSLELARLD